MYRTKMATLSLFTAFLLAIASTAEPVNAQLSVQQGLVNVTVQDISIETGDIVNVENNVVNVTVAANIVAQVCGVTVPVAVLSDQIFRQGGYTCSVEDTENDIRTVLSATQVRGRR